MKKTPTASLLAMALLGGTAQAATTNFTWTGTASGLFSSAANWVIDQPAPGTAAPRAPSVSAGDDFAIFQGGVTQRTIDLGGFARNVRGIRFDNVAGANGFTFNLSGLTTSTSSFGFNLRPDGIVNNDTDTQTFNTAIKLFTYAGGNPNNTITNVINAAAGNLNFSGTWTSGQAGKGTIDLNGGTIVFTGSADTTVGGAANAGIINSTTGTGRLIKTGSGQLNLNGTSANTYSGGTIITAGTVNANKANALGTGFLHLTGGTLSIGANNQTVGAVTNAGGTINGTGTITGSSYNLQGGTINAKLGGSGTVRATAGNTVLGGANTYTGPTIISTNATITLAADERIADTSNLELNGGTLNTGGYFETMGTLTLSGDSVINFANGTGGLAFSDSSGINWDGYTLTIENWTPGSDTFRVGTDANGLTADQLDNILFADYGNVGAQIDILGYITPVPEPSSLVLGALGGVGVLLLVRRKKN